VHADEAKGATIAHDMESLGVLNVPLVSDEIGNDPAMAKSMGYPEASKVLFGVVAATTSTSATSIYARDYQQYVGGSPAPSSSIFYDGVNIMSLAMVAAKSTDPKVWVNFVTQVSNPPGTACYDFVGCVDLLNKGQKINYEGVAGNYDYNQYHSIFGAYGVTAWNADGTSHTSFTITQGDLGAF